MSAIDRFPADYLSSRERFRQAAAAAGATLEAYPIGLDGPDGTPLTLDVARLGTEGAPQPVVVSSGLHGVEGYLGAAIQLALLEDVLPQRPLHDGQGLVLLHALNPYGFAHTRRVNEDNVDLNRNMLCDGQAWAGSPPLYGELSPLLNPPKPPPGLVSAFLPKAAYYLARYGMPALKDAVAGGQYDHPKGLFFGGSGPSATLRILDAELARWVAGAERVLHVDVHTGLGPHGSYKLLVDHPWRSDGLRALTCIFGDELVQPWEPEEGVSYQIRGGLGTWCKARLPDVSYDVLCAEFGTTNILAVIAALHHENRAHLWGEPASATTRAAKARLREVFAPSAAAWRTGTLEHGLQIVGRALEAS
ncbi:MAG: hypothetical protein ACI8PZ_007117 [Myxococcota bacterium]|jgi:hypothetical protein